MDTAVIFAGGLGTRLKPLTDHTPKPLLPVLGVPTLQHILDLLVKYNFKKVILTLHHHANKIKEYFGDDYMGMKLKYYVEEEALGNAGALNFLNKEFDKTFFHIHGDILTDVDIDKMYELHRKRSGLGTMGLVEVEDPSPFSSVVLDDEKIINYVYKPKKGDAPSNIVNGGWSILEPEVLSLIKEKKISDIDHDIFKKIIFGREMYGYVHEGLWFPIDTIEKLDLANKNWIPFKHNKG